MTGDSATPDAAEGHVRRLTSAETARAAKLRAAGSAPKQATAMQAVLWAATLAAGLGSLAVVIEGTSSRLSDRLLAQDGGAAALGPVGLAVQRPGSADYFETLSEAALDEAPANLKAAKAAAEQAVAIDPSRAHVWARLAYLDYVDGGKATPASVEALGKSIEACPLCDAGLIRWRFNFVLANWMAMPEDIRRRAFEGADLLRWAGAAQDQDFLSEMRAKAIAAGVPFDAYRSAVTTPVKSWDVQG